MFSHQTEQEIQKNHLLIEHDRPITLSAQAYSEILEAANRWRYFRWALYLLIFWAGMRIFSWF